ncbi:hypothetical protein D3C84_305230 [compost metagenome]
MNGDGKADALGFLRTDAAALRTIAKTRQRLAAGTAGVQRDRRHAQGDAAFIQRNIDFQRCFNVGQFAQSRLTVVATNAHALGDVGTALLEDFIQCQLCGTDVLAHQCCAWQLRLEWIARLLRPWRGIDAERGVGRHAARHLLNRWRDGCQ